MEGCKQQNLPKELIPQDCTLLEMNCKSNAVIAYLGKYGGIPQSLEEIPQSSDKISLSAQSALGTSKLLSSPQVGMDMTAMGTSLACIFR